MINQYPNIQTRFFAHIPSYLPSTYKETMTTPNPVVTPFMSFVKRCISRLHFGQEVYGTRMFSEWDGVRLCQEAKEEVFDIANYAFALHERLDRLEKVLSRKEFTDLWDECENV